MEFRQNSRQNYIQHRNLFFQKEINLRNETFGISDQEITFEKVQELATSMKQNRKYLFQTVEQIIELGTLQNWALKFAQQSVKDFIDCVHRNEYKDIAKYEEEICNKVNLLSEIQILFTKERYKNSPSSDTTILQELLIRPKYNLFEVVIYSHNWKVNYISSKYIYSLTKNTNYFESSETNKIYNLIKNYSLHQNIFLKVMKENNIFLTLGHFLPEYFDKEQTLQTLKSWKFDLQNQWRQKINKKDEKDQTDFIINSYLKQSKIKDINSELIQTSKWEEIINKKLALVKDNFEDIVNLTLAFFFTHQSYYDGYEFDYSSNYNQDQSYVIIHSIYSIKPEALKDKEKFFIDFFIPEILSTNINCNGSNHFQYSKDFMFVQKFIDNILKPYNKLSEIEYVFDLIEGLKVVIYNNENLLTVYDILEQENNQNIDSVSQAKQQLEFFEEYIIDNAINKNDYNNLLLASCLVGKEFTKVKITKLLIHLFELQTRNETLDKLNIQQTFSYTRFANHTICDQIYKDVAQSKMENLVNYLHLHYVEKNCPYGNFFIRTMGFIFSQISEYQAFSIETALKLIQIYRRYINDQSNSVFSNQGCFFEIIHRIALRLQKEPEYQNEYEECGLLFMRWSFYVFTQQYFDQITFGFTLETKFTVYFEKFFQTEFKQYYENDKKLILQQYDKYNPANYSISRALQNFMVLKNNLLAQTLIQFFGHYYYYFKISISQPIKITKDNFQLMIKYDLQNISPFCLMNRNIISHYSFMSYFSIKTCELYDESGNKLENCNYVSAYLEIFDQFLKENMETLQKAAKKIKSLPLERTQRNILQHISSQIKCEQDYEEIAICRRFSYLIQFGFGLFSHFESYDLAQCKYVFSQEVVCQLVTQIMKIYDFRQFCQSIGIQNYELLKSCNQEESIEYLNLFKKGKLFKIFQSGTYKYSKQYEIDIFEQIPFTYIKKLITYCSEQPYYPDIINNLASNLISQCNDPSSSIQSILENEDKITFEEFFKQSAYFNIVIKIINRNIKSNTHQIGLLADEELIELKKKKKNKNDNQADHQSKLFYISNIDILLKDQIAYQQFVLKILKKENIQIFINQRAKANDFHNLFIEFLDSFITSSLSMVGTLLSLVHSQNPKYIRQTETINLLNQLINNTYIIIITQLNNGGEWGSYSTSQASDFLDSFNNIIDSYSNLGLDIDPLVSEAQVLYSQFGQMISENLSRVLNDTGYEVEVNAILKHAIEIDFSLQKALKRQELREICKREILDEELKKQSIKLDNVSQQESDNKENLSSEKQQDVSSQKNEEQEKSSIQNNDENLSEKNQEIPTEKIEQQEQDKKETGEQNEKLDEQTKMEEDKKISEQKKNQELNDKIEKKLKEMEENEKEKNEKEESEKKKQILIMMSKQIALFLNDVFYKDALSQNQQFAINKDIQAILNLPNPINPIQTFGLNEFFSKCFTKLNTVNNANVKYIHQHLKRMIIYIGRHFDCLKDIQQDIPFLKATEEGKKLYSKDEEIDEYEELLLFDSFIQFYDNLCYKFEILKKNQRDFICLNDVLEICLDTPSILRQFSLTPQELQQFYDKCLDISQFVYELKIKYKNEGLEIEMSSQYLSVLDLLTEDLFKTLKALSNLVPNIRLQALEALIYNYLELNYYKSNPWEEIKQSILYFINVIFIAKGGANFKHFLRKCIAQDIITQKFEIQQKDQAQNDSKSQEVEEKDKKNKKEDIQKSDSDEDDNNSIVFNGLIKKKKKGKKDRKKSTSDSSSSEEDESSSQISNSSKSQSDEDISILFDALSLSGDYEIENIDQDKYDKIHSKKNFVEDEIKESKNRNKKQKRQDKDNEEDDNSSSDEKSKVSIDDDDKSKHTESDSDGEEQEEDDEEEESESQENSEESSSSSSSSKSSSDEDDQSSSSSEEEEEEDDDNSSQSKSQNDSIFKKKKQTKKKEKDQIKKLNKQQIIVKNLENLENIRFTLTQIQNKILSKYSIICQCYSQVFYEVINEFFEVTKIQIISPTIQKDEKDEKNEKKDEKSQSGNDDKNLSKSSKSHNQSIQSEKKDFSELEDEEESKTQTKEDKQNVNKDQESETEQDQNGDLIGSQILCQEDNLSSNREQENQDKQEQSEEEQSENKSQNADTEKDEENQDNGQGDNSEDGSNDESNSANDQQSDKKEQKLDQDLGENEEEEEEEDSKSKSKLTTQSKSNEKIEEKEKKEDEQEECKSKSQKEDEEKEKKIKRVIIYKLRNPDEVKKLYENRHKLVKMSQQQIDFVQYIINIFVQKVNNINQELQNVNEVIKFKFIPKIEKSECDYIDIETIQNYIISLIQNYQHLILPHLDEFKVNNIQKEKHDTLYLFDQHKSKTNFIDYLIHITLITNYQSQDILNYIVFSSFQYKDQDINKQILRQIFLKIVSILKQILEQPDFFINMKIHTLFDGILNIFKNILENIEEKKKEDGLLILSLFQKFINKAQSMKQLEQLFYLEIFNLYEKSYNYIMTSIYGDDLNIEKETDFVSENFLQYFQKDQIQKSLEQSFFDSDKIVSNILEDDQHKKLFDTEWEFEDEQQLYKYQQVDNTSQFNIFKEVKNNYFLYIIIKNQKTIKLKDPPKNFEKNSPNSFAEYFETFKLLTEGNKNTVFSNQFKNSEQIKHLNDIYNNTKIEIKSNNIYYYQMNKYLLDQRKIKEDNQIKELNNKDCDQNQDKQSSNQEQQAVKISEITFVDENVEKQIQEQYEQAFCKIQVKKQILNAAPDIKQPNQKDIQEPKEQIDVKDESKPATDLDEKDYVCPSVYGFQTNDLERFNIDRNHYVSLSPDQRQTLLEEKQKEFNKKEREKKLKVIREREKMQLESIFGNKEDYEKNKKDFQKFLKSKEFNKTVKGLEKEEQRLILLSQDSEYLKLLDTQMRKKAQQFLKKQKISKKKKSKSQDKNEEKSQIFKGLKKIIKSTDQHKQKKKEKQLTERINKSLQVPQIEEDVALKMTLCLITGGDQNMYKETYSNILDRAFINPFNYIRILGLILVISSKIIKKSKFNIEWLDKILFNTRDKFLNSKHQNKGDTEEEKNNIYRNMLIEKCTDLIQELLINKKYGLIILQFEEFLFGKSFDKLEIISDKSTKLSKLKPQVFEYNILNENTLDLNVTQYDNLEFLIQYEIFKKNQSEAFSNINEYILGVLNLCIDKKKIGVHNQSNSNQPYGKEYIDFIDNQSNHLIENVLELFCSINNKIKYTNIKVSSISDQIKNSIFREKQKQNSLTIINMKEQIIIKNYSMKNTNPIFEKIFQYIILYCKNLENYSSLHDLMKIELSNYDKFVSISDQLLSEYGVQMKKVVDDVLPVLKQYKLFIKNKHNKENLYEEILDEDGNDVHSNLKEPITSLLSNIYSFLQEYAHTYYRNLKFIISCIDNLLEQRMIHYFEEFESRKTKSTENEALIWWNERELFEKQALYDEIKVNWMEETKPLSQFYVEFFEFVHVCLKLQLVSENNMPNYYNDFEICLKSFLRIYNTFYKDSKQKDDSLDQEEIILNEDEIQMPVLKRIQTLTPNDIFEGEDEIQPSLKELKNVRKYSTMLHKNYNSIKADDLYEALRTKFVPLINRYMNNRKNNMWVILMSEFNQGKMTIENKICYVKAISRKENKNRSNPDEYYEMNCVIDREEIWYSIYKLLSGLPPSSLVTEQFEIVFKDENGVDAGGLSREFYTIVLKDFLDPYKGFFCPSSNGITTQPSPNSNIIPDHLLHFKYAGRLIAKSILDSFVCEIDLTRSFLKQILGKELYINDLEDIDPDLAKNLMWILDNDVSNLYLDFTYTHNDFGKQQIIELKPNGSHIEVNEENKKEYVKLLAQYRMVKQIEPQIKAFQQGFYEVIPYKAIKIFTVRELGFKLSGEKKIDLEDLKQNLNYQTYTKDSDQIKWLFEILEEYNQEQRAGFLFFVTGSFRVPFGGFSNYKLTISKLNDTQSLPVAHTCSKEMELPFYESKEIMKEKFEIAFTEGVKGFYIG
ncbi:kinesin motor domain protein (macronuclear) [Tetrahymena thermophila SB210]|uniref:HECT-type E3 ubiquitin transferase n=1 Tax=Tetrahymena thermophila (strain SB210) TaxID=312017 RepID=I7MAC8_TETTS|nr:kinesin motor domain protein [Tetrahymena thermophila SB210]EAS04336.2 kinesin motor domain protein [Tetrahymena thermophila SB210]|eukprot:XP_001024581.2 kinesin motor domain protein [Tetrahymena thermophila SB210]